MKIGRKEVGFDHPTYFIADIASNHNGSLTQAERLIYLAAEAGADAVKFQNFKADTLISNYGFEHLGKQSHQAEWKESVFDTYRRYETPLDWAPDLKRIADSAGIDYLTTPYDVQMLHYLSEYTCAWKIGSGDITYETLVRMAANYDKPLIISTGASTEEDIERVLGWLPLTNRICDVVLMQCNTNYTNDANNISYVNLKVLVSWWGGGVIGLSDHTHGHAAVLGAVALGARVIEKHFTEDNLGNGPDHAFAMEPVEWATMVGRTRELEFALGDGIKKVEENEKETVVLQRRAIRAKHDIASGKILTQDDLLFLRPCPENALPPYLAGEVVGAKVRRDVKAGDCILEAHLK